jgi:hypothetical protein
MPAAVVMSTARLMAVSCFGNRRAFFICPSYRVGRGARAYVHQGPAVPVGQGRALLLANIAAEDISIAISWTGPHKQRMRL